jgi:hypothetical protein
VAGDKSVADSERTAGDVDDTKQKKIASLKKKVKDLAESCPSYVCDPNFSRWGSISVVAKVVLNHWVPLVCMAQNIIDMEKSK